LVGEAAGLTLAATGTEIKTARFFMVFHQEKHQTAGWWLMIFGFSGQSSISSNSLAGFNPSTVFKNLDTSCLSRDLLNLTHLCYHLVI
jgi:hypothetical protein